eukprot:TRINITY_DN1716_c2_g1_i1.p2 TRINITY_DN1716_c2_g1~~TRINITY_DN1716_c2_g1_i1.p2  ORF type:complete len:140 (-),score=5.53 TRINITY_DN1716_c2_g1_i1:269-658(-)
MIQKGTKLFCIDNSGAALLQAIHIFGKQKLPFGYPGSTCVVAVKRLRKSVPDRKVEKSDVKLALIVGCAKRINRANGTTIRATTNTAVILKKDEKTGNTPLASRIIGPVFAEIREKGYGKLLSMARGVL